MWMIGRGLSLFAETSFNSRLGGLCTVPFPGLTKVKVKVKCVVGPIQGAQGGKSTG